MAAKKKFKLGDRVEVVANNGNHGAPVGSVATISQAPGNGYYRLAEFPNWNFQVAELKLVPNTFTKATLEADKAKAAEAVALLDSKLAFLDETGQDEGSEKEFRVFQTLSLVEDKKLTKTQKAKAIAGLLEDQ